MLHKLLGHDVDGVLVVADLKTDFKRFPAWKMTDLLVVKTNDGWPNSIQNKWRMSKKNSKLNSINTVKLNNRQIQTIELLELQLFGLIIEYNLFCE